MLLASYQNPPYKAPTSNKQDSSSTPPQPSDGHKRSGSDRAGIPLKIDTSQNMSDNTASGLDSPRSKVAERLQTLEIHQQHQPQQAPRPSQYDDGRPSKRMKREPSTDPESSHVDNSSGIASTPEAKSMAQAAFSNNNATLVPEIQETPDWQSQGPNETTLPTNNAMENVLDLAVPSVQAPKTSPRKRLASPPPPLASPKPSSASKKPHRTDSATSSPSSKQDDTSTYLLNDDPTSLTWQDDEITGHELDANDPGDDGLGINGIGFRPTPAEAEARSQRRKKQIANWKAQEAKEARQRRMDRRRGGEEGPRSDPVVEGRRTVRFQDSG
ncbi:hypothetical protein KC343_g12169 [Hortaea werneckii]|uniref:Uncharacterized protein n=1 Tax=Hortaea werneckii TaxID=91943 RepID=A0A3M7DLX8_HORWE|nr:hypothetical protein KC323_g3899 [Hortaea werneckii]KAI6875325.1 hypothetical protein KC338_g816 [Hortaea werneckii]KAI7158550.1 hypothetical protein KC352_g27227 [Hortaea werneckii]KAI7353986.1 hypothetical protein KC320_g3746 [Hortaea werneckii]KAI7556755.1 hypothetical protein KC317_g12063 [Hortaea werneckii]